MIEIKQPLSLDLNWIINHLSSDYSTGFPEGKIGYADSPVYLYSSNLNTVSTIASTHPILLSLISGYSLTLRTIDSHSIQFPLSIWSDSNRDEDCIYS